MGHLTLRHVVCVLKGVLDRETAMARARRADLYALAQLITVGHHQPKRFPRPASFLGDDRPGRRGSSDAKIAAYFRHLSTTRPA